MAKSTIHNHLPGRLNLLSLLDADLSRVGRFGASFAAEERIFSA
jgi:hypothetical protein